jgi:hypothetical protein
MFPQLAISHNVAIRQNKTIDWIPQIANVLTKNINVWYTALATPNKFMSFWGSWIKLVPSLAPH